MKRRRESKHAAVHKLLARHRPKHELVTRPKRRKGEATAHAATPEIAKLRAHAAKWMRKHGVAHRDLADLRKPAPKFRGGSRTPGSRIIHVRHRASVLAHPPHPPKHLVISLATGKIVAEQG